ncbi:thiol peroxidase [Campylobacter sp. RM16704]|uniref:thiol peroxidase n=1 Tax=Campylobacter sp. RM16704 TaxID=1500960 RepID=UPI00057D6C5C|nr:thiol peroxidase [Campylobacter sp. RM16704]AJC86692.1 lipid hydroperoxide peroxidase [Campylobacter sp. RM16704]
MTTIMYKEQKIELIGEEIKVGDIAPKITLRTKNLAPIEIAPAGKTQIILTFPSLDTQICSKQAKESNKRLANMKNIEVIIVSMDLPFAMDRFCATEGINNIIVASDFAFKDFGNNYGVLISNSIFAGLLARSAFIIKDGKVVYKQIVEELMGKIDFKDIELFMHKNYGYPLN